MRVHPGGSVRRLPHRVPAVLGVAAAVHLVLAPTASAHGIGGGDAGALGVMEFVPLGMWHMVLGWDHILFIAGVVLLSARWQRAAKLISLFVLGHSTTLIMATLLGWRVNAALVDVIIVLSVFVVGGYGLLGGPRRWWLFGLLVTAFGLVHGLGLATRFQALGVPEDGMLPRVIAFNVGVELGQLLGILVVLALGFAVSRLVPRRRALLRTAAYGALLAVGVVAAPILTYQGLTAPDQGSGTVALPEGSGCVVGEWSGTLPSEGGVHTGKVFYGPGEQLPVQDFGHAVGDGYEAVFYPRTLGADDVEALRAYVSAQNPRIVLAGPATGSETSIQAITAERQMTCESVHIGALRQFHEGWLDYLNQRTRAARAETGS